MESPSPTQQADGQTKQARAFGLVFSVFFGILAVWPLLDHNPIRLWAGGLAFVFLFLSLVLPGTLDPLSRQWLRFGTLLHRIMSPIIMGVLFFIVLTPIALLLRLRGHDVLSLSFDPKRSSYWINREKPSTSSESMTNQF